jgi:hypothetical protein
MLRQTAASTVQRNAEAGASTSALEKEKPNPMSERRAAWLAWTLCGIVGVTTLIMLGIDFANRAAYGSAMAFANHAIGNVLPIVFAIPAALIVSRQPRNAIGWLLMTPAVLFVVVGLIDIYVQSIATAAPTPTLPLLLMVWFSGWSWLLLIFPLLHIPLLFPTSRPLSPRWRWVSVAAVSWAAVFVLLVTFVQTFTDENGPTPLVLPNPLGVIPAALLEQLIGLWQIGLVVLTALCVAALFVRYRRATPTEREQIKWLLYACGVFAANYIIGAFVLSLGESETLAGYVFNISFGLTTMAIPIAIAIAILRYRLWDIDVLIRRTLVYSILTLVLALVYTGCIVLSRMLVAPLTGGSELAIVASTLAIAALFNPLRKRIQTLIDRRFFRRKYDAAKVLAAFGATVRDETDLDALTAAMLKVVDETMQPEFVGLRLREASDEATG